MKSKRENESKIFRVQSRRGKQPVISRNQLPAEQVIPYTLPVKHAKREAVRRLTGTELPEDWKSEEVVSWISVNLRGKRKEYENVLAQVYAEERFREVKNNFRGEIEVEFSGDVDPADNKIIHFIAAEIKGFPLQYYKKMKNPIVKIVRHRRSLDHEERIPFVQQLVAVQKQSNISLTRLNKLTQLNQKRIKDILAGKINCSILSIIKLANTVNAGLFLDDQEALDDETLNEILCNKRIELGLRRDELANESGVNVYSIYCHETNRKKTYVDNFLRLTRTLGINVQIKAK